MADSLLPSNTTDLEKAVSQAVGDIHQLPVPLRELWNPQTCPLELLPHLAWSLSIDEWQQSWSEETKRQVIASSINVHQHKGTRGAIRRALDALGLDIQLVEWFEMEPQGLPYTYEININIDVNGFESTDDNQIQRIINEVSNVRSHATTVNINITSVGERNHAAVQADGIFTTIYPN